MLSGRRLGAGFGYDIGLFNPAGRSGAVRLSDADSPAWLHDARTVVGRIQFDNHDWHAELSHGLVPQAGGDGTDTYRVTDFGLSRRIDRWHVKAEYIGGEHVAGANGWRQAVGYVHAGYQFTPAVEGVVRHYQGKSTLDGVSTALGNTFVGVNLRLTTHATIESRLQFNYVVAGNDRGAYSGLGGYRGNAALVQWQIAFLPAPHRW